jgi:hypothetical protein
MTTSASRRPLIQDLVKAAMDSSSERAKIADEFTRQGAGAGTDAAPEEKTASAKPVDLHDFALKLANAVEEATPPARRAAEGEGGQGLPRHRSRRQHRPRKQRRRQAALRPGTAGSRDEHHPDQHRSAEGASTDATTQVPNTIATPAGGPGHQKVSSAPIDLIRAKIASAKTEKKETEGMQQAEAGLAKAEAATLHGEQEGSRRVQVREDPVRVQAEGSLRLLAGRLPHRQDRGRRRSSPRTPSTRRRSRPAPPLRRRVSSRASRVVFALRRAPRW